MNKKNKINYKQLLRNVEKNKREAVKLVQHFQEK